MLAFNKGDPRYNMMVFEIRMNILTFGMLKIETSKGILSKLDPILDIAFVVSYDVSFKSAWFDLIQVPMSW